MMSDQERGEKIYGSGVSLNWTITVAFSWRDTRENETHQSRMRASGNSHIRNTVMSTCPRTCFQKFHIYVLHILCQ